MKYEDIGKLVTAALAAYFVVSGLNAIFAIDAKLERVGLSAINSDGKVAFILIYTSLMVGIGTAMAVLYAIYKSCAPSLILAGCILLCFIVFRVVSSLIFGTVSGTQLGFIVVELLELAVVVFVFTKIGGLNKRLV